MTEVHWDLTDAVATITLDGPDRSNRLEGTMRERLLELLRTAEGDDDVRCVVITGAGNAFSAGADLEGMLELHAKRNGQEIERRVRLGGEIVRLVRSMPKPVVAGINGVAAGAGANLALACDVRIGSTRARFVQAFVKLGLLPDWGGIDHVVRAAGPGAAADLLLSGEPVDASRALALGLLQHVHPEDEFPDALRGYASRLAAAPRAAVREIKRGIGIVARGGNLGDVLDLELTAQPELFLGADCEEGMRALLERREPRFG